jgi:hypothetical protein
MISTEKQKTEVRMRRIITLILLAADIYLGVQIYRSFMNDQFNLAALSFKNEHTAGNEADYPVGSDSYNPGNAEGPHYFSGSSIPTGQVTLGGSHKTDESASSSQTYRDEDYGTSDGFVIQRFQEFDWYRNAGSAGIPAGAQRLTDPSEIYGIYHVYVRFDPNDQNSTIADLLGDARIDAGQYGTLVHMDWNYTYYHKNGKGEMDDTSSDFTGSLNNGAIQASGPGTLSIDSFFYDEGEIRAVGTMETTNGIPANLALVKQ